jgi:transcriptional regulator with XRE-family HTH domain
MTENRLFPIGKQIKLIRTIQELDIRSLAAKSGVGMTYISLIENGRVMPTEEQLQLLETALNVQFDEPEVKAVFSVLANIARAPQELPNAQ